MDVRRWLGTLVVVSLLVGHGTVASGQAEESATIEMSVQMLKEITTIPAQGIPRAMLADASGIALVPNVVKLGFVVAGRHGRGVLSLRREDGSWSDPVFITLSGGSVGWQIGAQATDVVLVFKTRKSVDGLLNGKFTLGADAGVAAGPVGRQASAATDAKLKSEIYSYSRSRGLFAGVSLDGSVMQVDGKSNALYYGRPGITPQEITSGTNIPTLPPSINLKRELSNQSPGVVSGATVVPGAPQAMVAEGIVAARSNLVASFQRLEPLLDDQWKQFLALPPEVFTGQQEPSVEVLQGTLNRYETIAADPRYQLLFRQAEFQATREALRNYVAQRSANVPASGLQLPAPPVSGGARY